MIQSVVARAVACALLLAACAPPASSAAPTLAPSTAPSASGAPSCGPVGAPCDPNAPPCVCAQGMCHGLMCSNGVWTVVEVFP